MGLLGYIFLGIVVVLVVCALFNKKNKNEETKAETGCKTCSGCSFSECPSRKKD